ncbi:HNH endonuclease [Cyanobium sp. ATX 6A2]|uniref:HNH endonuclease n=1 Tax=Cyanobium sp. ATX 6A2 TaxID=2823700 RepID=UPI0037C088CA
MPRNQGGSDDLSNLRALCFRCNAARQQQNARAHVLRTFSIRRSGTSHITATRM